MSVLVELKSVSAGYGNLVVLKDVVFKIMETDFIGVIGPNGGGKTTLLKIILGQLKPFSGSVEYYGKLKIENLSIGYLPQFADVDKKFPITVKEVILSGYLSKKKLFKKFLKKDKLNTEKLLERLEIQNLRNNNISDLSGGELQRVLLGRAIVSNPKLLILDEPNTFVDNKFEHDLYNLLSELNNDMAIIMVSHDIGTISSYIKSIACVNKTLHHHTSNIITQDQLAAYDCPVQLIAHGDVPHTVLDAHKQ